MSAGSSSAGKLEAFARVYPLLFTGEMPRRMYLLALAIDELLTRTDDADAVDRELAPVLDALDHLNHVVDTRASNRVIDCAVRAALVAVEHATSTCIELTLAHAARVRAVLATFREPQPDEP